MLTIQRLCVCVLHRHVEGHAAVHTILRLADLRPLNAVHIKAVTSRLLRGRAHELLAGMEQKARGAAVRGEIVDVAQLIVFVEQESSGAVDISGLAKDLTGVLTPLQPRNYSITSIPDDGADNPSTLSIVISSLWYTQEGSATSGATRWQEAVAMVRSRMARRSSSASPSRKRVSSAADSVDSGEVTKTEHQGVCSTFLTGPALMNFVPMRVVEATDFHLPDDLSLAPLVFVGLGSGIAPMFAFLRHIAQTLEAASTSERAWKAPPSVTLIWGLRKPEHMHMEDELLHYIETIGIELLICFSQVDSELQIGEDPVSGKPTLEVVPGARQRITTALTMGVWPSKLYALVEEGAIFYMCGHPSLQNSLRTALENALTLGSNISAKAAALRYEYLSAQGHLKADLYFSGNQYSPNAKVYSHADVSRHHEMSDLWCIFKGLVYDFTAYAALHPGGAKLLFDKAGRDCTEDFEVAHGAGNMRVESMMVPYMVGTLRPAPANATQPMRIVFDGAALFLDGVWEVRNAFTCDVNNFTGASECGMIAHSSYHHHLTIRKLPATMRILEGIADALVEKLAAARLPPKVLDLSFPKTFAGFAVDMHALLTHQPLVPSMLIMADALCRVACDTLTRVGEIATDLIDAVHTNLHHGKAGSTGLPPFNVPLPNVCSRLSALFAPVLSTMTRLATLATKLSPPRPTHAIELCAWLNPLLGELPVASTLERMGEADGPTEWEWALGKMMLRAGGALRERLAAEGAMDELSRHLTRIELEQGDELLRKGESHDKMLLLQHGEVSSASSSAQNEILSPGTVFGIDVSQGLGFQQAAATLIVSSSSAVVWALAIGVVVPPSPKERLTLDKTPTQVEPITAQPQGELRHGVATPLRNDLRLDSGVGEVASPDSGLESSALLPPPMTIMDEEEQKAAAELKRLLKAHPLFGKLADVAPVVDAVREMRVPKGTIVFEKGEGGDRLFIIKAGALNVLLGDAVVHTFHEGEIVGEMSLLHDVHRSLTCAAECDTMMLTLDSSAFVATCMPSLRAWRETLVPTLSSLPRVGGWQTTRLEDLSDWSVRESCMPNETLVEEGSMNALLHVVIEGSAAFLHQGKPVTAFVVGDIIGPDGKLLDDQHMMSPTGKVRRQLRATSAAQTIVAGDEGVVCLKVRVVHANALQAREFVDRGFGTQEADAKDAEIEQSLDALLAVAAEDWPDGGQCPSEAHETEEAAEKRSSVNDVAAEATQVSPSRARSALDSHMDLLVLGCLSMSVLSTLTAACAVLAVLAGRRGVN